MEACAVSRVDSPGGGEQWVRLGPDSRDGRGCGCDIRVRLDRLPATAMTAVSVQHGARGGGRCRALAEISAALDAGASFLHLTTELRCEVDT
ncbi:MAG: hypothetical protein H6976_15030 [Gammaproteobacteria bacterium]|nr:hypothetical protein [Gammaproteobacteria bacterium]